MHVTADLAAKITIYGAGAVLVGYMVALLWVQGEIFAIARTQRSSSDLLPDPSLATSRTFVVVLVWWTWTSAHQKVGDRILTRAVVTTRIMCVATICVWAALFAAPRDFAERLEAWSYGRTYVPGP